MSKKKWVYIYIYIYYIAYIEPPMRNNFPIKNPNDKKCENGIRRFNESMSLPRINRLVQLIDLVHLFYYQTKQTRVIDRVKWKYCC